MRPFLPLALVLTLEGCISSRPIGVQQLEANHAELTSKIVQVRGWLTPCGGRSCVLTDSLEYAEWLDLAVTHDGKSGFPSAPENDAAVSFGADTAFDAEVTSLRGSNAEVIIEARVTDRCWLSPPQIDSTTGEQTIEICADRGGQLEPIRLVRVLKAEPLPSRKKN